MLKYIGANLNYHRSYHKPPTKSLWHTNRLSTFGIRHTFGLTHPHIKFGVSVGQIVWEIWSKREFWTKCGQAWKVCCGDLISLCDKSLGYVLTHPHIKFTVALGQIVSEIWSKREFATDRQKRWLQYAPPPPKIHLWGYKKYSKVINKLKVIERCTFLFNIQFHYVSKYLGNYTLSYQYLHRIPETPLFPAVSWHGTLRGQPVGTSIEAAESDRGLSWKSRHCAYRLWWQPLAWYNTWTPAHSALKGRRNRHKIKHKRY